jgi:hypothetical protein
MNDWLEIRGFRISCRGEIFVDAGFTGEDWNWNDAGKEAFADLLLWSKH